MHGRVRTISSADVPPQMLSGTFDGSSDGSDAYMHIPSNGVTQINCKGVYCINIFSPFHTKQEFIFCLQYSITRAYSFRMSHNREGHCCLDILALVLADFFLWKPLICTHTELAEVAISSTGLPLSLQYM